MRKRRKLYIDSRIFSGGGGGSVGDRFSGRFSAKLALILHFVVQSRSRSGSMILVAIAFAIGMLLLHTTLLRDSLLVHRVRARVHIAAILYSQPMVSITHKQRLYFANSPCRGSEADLRSTCMICSAVKLQKSQDSEFARVYACRFRMHKSTHD